MDFHVLSVHVKDGTDSTPLQFISNAKLAYYRRAEALVQAFCALAVGALLAAVIVYVRASGILVGG